MKTRIKFHCMSGDVRKGFKIQMLEGKVDPVEAKRAKAYKKEILKRERAVRKEQTKREIKRQTEE